MRATISMAIATVLLLSGCGQDRSDDASHKAEAGSGQQHAEGGHEHSEAAGDEHGRDEHEESASLRLTDEQITRAGIELAQAGPSTIHEQLTLYGTVVPNAERVRTVGARFPGVIQSVFKRVGDSVKEGERLAVVESNESLNSYPVVAPLSGVVTERNANEGEQAGTAPLFTVADLSTVWVELALFPRDVNSVRVGQQVEVSSSVGNATAQGKVVYVAPLGSRANQTVAARVLLNNAEGRWAPGLYVTANVSISQIAVDVSVRNTAIQAIESDSVVFVRTDEGFEPRVVQLGKRDSQSTQIVSGVEQGERYAAANSFILKAELGKGTAEHDH